MTQQQMLELLKTKCRANLEAQKKAKKNQPKQKKVEQPKVEKKSIFKR